MNEAITSPPGGRPLWASVLAVLAALLALLALLIALFPWDWLRGPLNRYVSERTGRHFEITRKLDIRLGGTIRILADGIEFANPPWAKDPHLVVAGSAEIDVKLWPLLLHRRIELPLITLRKPVLGLQAEPDGRRTWALGRDTADQRNLPLIGSLVVDEGSLHYIASQHGADIHTDFAIDGNAGDKLPLTFKARGTWKKENFTAHGRTGSVLPLGASRHQPFSAEVDATAANTSLHAAGSVASLVALDAADAEFSLQGRSLSELYKLLGLVLPETPRYAIKGHLNKQGEIWNVSRISGRLGNSDLEGQLAFDRSLPVPLLTGKVQSKALDFDDLAPLVGLPEQPRSASALAAVAAAAPVLAVRTPSTAGDPGRKVLPTATLDLVRLKAMNADVHYSAARITNVRQLPLERMSAQVTLKDGVLQLDPMELGVAGGSVAGHLRINGNGNPAVAEVRLDARSLELGQLFPGVKITQASFGKVHGLIDLKGRGNSAAQMLGTSSGNVAMLMGKGQVSNLLLEFAGLDGGEIIKFMIKGDHNVQLRCAAASFSVDQGLMRSRTLVLDTSDTVIYGEGALSLAAESMDLTLRPYPKDKSILALRSPLKLSGTFAAPHAGVDKGALLGRAGVALALGAINPLLALAATFESGPGKDADCGAVLRDAAAPAAAARAAAAGTPAPAPEKFARKHQPWTGEQIYRQ